MTGGERRSGRSVPSIALPAALAIGSAGPALLLIEAGLALLAVAWQVTALGACWVLGRRTAARPAPRVGTLDGWRAFQRELHRSRRRGYELTLVRVPQVLDDERTGDHPLRAAVNGVLRRTDHVWRHGNDLIVLLPETSGEAASRAVDRIGRVARARSEDGVVPSAPRIASFPEDGLTSSALIAAIRSGPAARREAPAADAGAGAASPVAAGGGRPASQVRRGSRPVVAGAVAASAIAFGDRGHATESVAASDEGALG